MTTGLDEPRDGTAAGASGREAPVPENSTANVPGEAQVRGWRSLLAGTAAYLALSVGVWWHVWSTHPTAVTTCGCGDSSLFTWFLAWPAFALRHGMDPLYSTYLFHPTGVNLLSNTAEIGFGLVLAPVTWAFGPVATLNTALTLSPALSALAMYVLLRRWVAWAPAAFLGGLLYGFSPFVLVSLTDAHLMLGMAAVPPLVVLCLDELLVRQRWRWWATGLAVGALALVQFSVGTELLVITVIAAGIGVVLVVGFAALFRREVLVARYPYAWRAAAAALASSVALLAWPAWFALAGPAHLSGNVWGSSQLSYGGTTVRYFLHGMAPDPKVTQLTHQVGGYQAPSLSGQLLGIGLVAVLLVGLVVWRRDLRLWLFAAVGLVGAAFSLGLSYTGWSPWRLLVRAPLLDNLVPSRFVLVTYLCAAVMLGVVLDRVRAAAAGRAPRTPGRTAAGWCAGLGVALVALVPIASYLADGLPLTAVPVQLPEWFTTVAPDLPPGQVLVVFPFAFRQGNMTWQSVAGFPYAMVGGGGPNSLLSRAGRERDGYRDLSQLSFLVGSRPFAPGEVAEIRRALDGWGVTGIVLPDPRGLPPYDRTPNVGDIVVALTAATGQAPTYRAGAWMWSDLRAAPPALDVPVARLEVCAAPAEVVTGATVAAAADCVLATPAAAAGPPAGA